MRRTVRTYRKKKPEGGGTLKGIAIGMVMALLLTAGLYAAGIIPGFRPAGTAGRTTAPGQSVTGQAAATATATAPATVEATVRPTEKFSSARTDGPSPSPGYTGSLDMTALAALDNTTLSWWIRLNDTHTTPGIDADIRALLDKHNGLFTGNTAVKKIYLTFDEGYENGFTPLILDTLRAEGVRALFFITSSYLASSRDLVSRMVTEGHEVGNHSVSHLSMPSLMGEPEKFVREVEGLTEAFRAEYGRSMACFRPPMGEYSARSLEALSQLGYKTIFWSFAYDDWYTDRQRGADYAYDIVMRNLHSGAVYLLHAVSSDNAHALERIIRGIRAEGYEIGDPADLL